MGSSEVRCLDSRGNCVQTLPTIFCFETCVKIEFDGRVREESTRKPFVGKATFGRRRVIGYSCSICTVRSRSVVKWCTSKTTVLLRIAYRRNGRANAIEHAVVD